MNLQAGVTYKYFFTKIDQGNDVLIDSVDNGIAYATSEQVSGFGSFPMLFDAVTGEGLKDYAGTRLVEYTEGEVFTEEFEVTFEHTGPFKNHTVIIEVQKDENMLDKAIEAMKNEGMGISEYNGYKSNPITWRQLRN